MPSRRLAMFPLSTVLFPYSTLTLNVFEQRYLSMVADCLAGDKTFGVVLITRGSEVGGGDQRVEIGTVAQIRVAVPRSGGGWLLGTSGSTRFAVKEWLSEDPFPLALVEELGPDRGSPEVDVDEAALEGAERGVALLRARLSEFGDLPPTGPPPPSSALRDQRLWAACAAAPVTVFDRQRLLEAPDALARLDLLGRLVEDKAGDLARMLNLPPNASGTFPH